MYKFAAVVGLVGLASAALEAPPAYGDPTSSAFPSSSVVVSSSLAAYPSSSVPASYPSSSAPAVYSSDPASSSSGYAFSSSAVASSTTSSSTPIPTCDCWSKCFEAAGIKGEDELCGNTEVSSCISSTCSDEEDKNYWSWYESFCEATSSSSSSSIYSTTTIVESSTPVSSSPATATPTCWTSCFGQAGITSEDELCGNQEVNSCIYYTCSQADDMAYWSWYNSYCPAPSTTASETYSTSYYASETYPTTTISISSTSSAPTTTATGDCWEVCFAENNVESQASLCGNDAVSKCIHDTCSSDLDKAYWDWYNSYCAVPTTGVSTITTIYTPTSPATYPGTTGETTYSEPPPYTTTYETTYTDPTPPVETSPVDSGLPLPPAPSQWSPATSAAPPAPYSSPAWSSPYSYPAGPTGTGSAWSPNSSPSGYPVVPATGAGAANKASGLMAVVAVIAAFL